MLACLLCYSGACLAMLCQSLPGLLGPLCCACYTMLCWSWFSSSIASKQASITGLAKAIAGSETPRTSKKFLGFDNKQLLADSFCVGEIGENSPAHPSEISCDFLPASPCGRKLAKPPPFPPYKSLVAAAVWWWAVGGR